jgi:hypothetical protein
VEDIGQIIIFKTMHGYNIDISILQLGRPEGATAQIFGFLNFGRKNLDTLSVLKIVAVMKITLVHYFIFVLGMAIEPYTKTA